MPPPDLLSWEFWVEAFGFWAKDSESLYRLALIVAGAIGIPLLYVRTVAANKSAKAAAAQARTAEQGHITDRFTKAVEQLGSDKMAVRLGAIYALERISQDSRRDHWTIMETLTAYVRERAPWPPRGQALANPFGQLQASIGDDTDSAPAEEPQKGESVYVRPVTDIQAVLTVLGRRDETARNLDEQSNRYLYLADTNLQGADLRSAHLEGANLRGAHLEKAVLWAHLEGANLWDAHLEGADLRSAHLEGADLWDAHLEGADLHSAHLEGANLRDAHLERACLSDAHLEGADLRSAHLEGADLRSAHLEGANLVGAHLGGADLSGTAGLTQEQLDRALGDNGTRLPEGLIPPARWAKATPYAKPFREEL